MDENNMNNVDKAFEELVEKADNLDKAIVEAAAKLPADAQTHAPVTNGKNVALGVGTFFGGIAVGAALDHWVVPAINKGLTKLKARRAIKKAERAAKKAAKQTANNPADPAPKAPATDDAGVDPTTIKTDI